MTTNPRNKKTDPVQAARAEGLIDPRLLEIAPARWPAPLRARYGVDQPVGDVVEPLTVEEAG
jgi:hypothetical protein